MKSNDTNTAEKQTLTNLFGPLIGGKDLAHVLGFKTSAAFRQAVRLKRLGINTFEIEGRRGRFAFTLDVEEWLKALKK